VGEDGVEGEVEDEDGIRVRVRVVEKEMDSPITLVYTALRI
jgi:hypothetical protein